MNSRLNLIQITTDQQRFDTIHAGGNPHIFTPHLNWMMDTGITFTRAYSDAPICVPARATMITGVPFYKRPPGYGDWRVPPAADPKRTLPGLLTAAGYQTRAIGKLHYEPPRCTYGFEHTELLEDYYWAQRRKGGPQPREHGVGENEMEPVISTVHETESLTTWITQRAVNFVETRDPTRPFFLSVNFPKPHPPLDPPFNYWALYQNRPMPKPIRGDWSQKVEDVPPGFMGSTYTLNRADRFSPEQWQDIRRAYYACITQIDYNIGLLLARLRELELLGNTIILFHSDHGEMLGDHFMGAKEVFLEGSAHIPMIMSLPQSSWKTKAAAYTDLTPGTRCDGIVTLADVMPTFLAAAGVPRPDELPETSGDMIAVHRGEIKRDKFVGAYNSPYSGQFALIEKEWKYLFTSTGGGELLFNLADDPMEQRNLAPQNPELCKAMHGRLAEELARHNYPGVDAATRTLQVIRPADSVSNNKRKRWPGFMSRDHNREDVIH